jgi:hypothetical protein
LPPPNFVLAADQFVLAASDFSCCAQASILAPVLSPCAARRSSLHLWLPAIPLLLFKPRHCGVICLSFNLLQELMSVMFLSYRIKKLEISWLQSFSHGGFLNTSVRCLNTPVRCSVKCLRGLELSFGLIFIASLARVLASIDSCFRCDP